MADAQLLQRPSDLREPGLSTTPARLRRIEIVRAAVGVERAEQTVHPDRFAKPEEARHRAFLFDEERRINPAGGVIHRHDQINIAARRRRPPVRRAVLEQHHTGQWTAHAPRAHKSLEVSYADIQTL